MSTLNTANLAHRQPSHHPRWFLCVDCGGTNTRCAISTSTGQIIGFGTGGPSNFSYIGLDAFLSQIGLAVTAALIEAGVPPEDAFLPYSSTSSTNSNTSDTSSVSHSFFTSAWVGVSGIDSPSVVARVIPRLSHLLSLPPYPPYLILKNDISLLSAPLISVNLGQPEIKTCVSVIGGTGSIAASFWAGQNDTTNGGEGVYDEDTRKANRFPQELARIGGWGWLLGDEGGGFHVGRTAIRHLLREYEFSVINGKPLTDRYSPGLREGFEIGSTNSVDPHTSQETEDQTSLRAQVLSLFNVQIAPELLPLLHDPDPDPDAGHSLENDIRGGRGSTSVEIAPHRLQQRQQRLSALAPLVFRAAFRGEDNNESTPTGVTTESTYGQPQSDLGRRRIRGDPLALAVLRETSACLADQICMLLQAHPVVESNLSNQETINKTNSLLVPSRTSLLVFGGSLLGIKPYQRMLLDALEERGHRFAGVFSGSEEVRALEFVHVQSPAREGALALAKLFSDS